MRRLGRSAPFASLLAFALAVAVLAIPAVSGASTSAAGAPSRLLRKVGTTTLAAAAASTSVSTAAESAADELRIAVKRSQRPHSEKITAYNAPTTPAPSASDLLVQSGSVRAWAALNEFDNRYAGGGQYSSEPADLGMCTDGSYVFELVNSALQVYSASGRALFRGTYQNTVSGYSGPKAIDLNAFFGFNPAVFRPSADPETFVYGPSLFDISCLYDDASERWFLSAAMLEVDEIPGKGDYTGENSVWIAVSSSRNPVSSTWSLFQIDTTNDGVDAAGDPDGSPDHDCTEANIGTRTAPVLVSQCFGDYPQIGLDTNGFYVTTNEFDWWGPNFNGAQVYAISKTDLLTGANSPRMVLYSGTYDPNTMTGTKGVSSSAFTDEEAYTLQPVNALASERIANTMYFGSSLSWYYGTGVGTFSVYTLDDTQELLNGSPDPTVMELTETVVDTDGVDYGLPPKARQRPGNTPGLTLYNSGGQVGRYPKIASPIPLDSGSGKFYGAWLDGGYVFLTTASQASGSGGAVIGSKGSWTSVDRRSAIAMFVVDVSTGVSDVVSDGRLIGVSGQNLVYPSVAVNGSGKGAIGATLAGPSYFPSAVYLPFQVDAGGSVTLAPSFRVALAGAGPNDGYTGWYPNYWRSRWGDYGATGIDSSGNIWMAAGYIAQTCTSTQYNADPTCGFKRDRLANWSTGIFRYVP